MLKLSFSQNSIISALILCSTLLVSCSKTEPPQITPPISDKVLSATDSAIPPTAVAPITIKIGFAAPITGPQAHLGKDEQYGAQMAIDELNAANTKVGEASAQFELLVEDDMADPRTATTIAQKFVDAGVNGVVGHLNSGTTIPASKIYHSNGIVQISPSATAIAYTAQGYENSFRVMANDGQQGKGLGNYAVLKMGLKNIAIIDDRTAYGQGLADEFEKAAIAAGATIVGREFTTDKSTDFNAILTTLKGKSPQLIFFGGMDAQGAPMVKQMRSLGMKMPFMGGDGVRSEEFLKLAAADAEGVIGSLPGVPFDQMPNGSEFKTKFEAKYGPIQLYSPYAYDAVKIMAAAMIQAGSNDPLKYLPALAAIKHSGVTANIAFDNKGDLLSGAVTLYVAEKGIWKVLETLGGPLPQLAAGENSEAGAEAVSAPVAAQAVEQPASAVEPAPAAAGVQ